MAKVPNRGGYQPQGMKDRFAGKNQLGSPSASSRQWDGGATKGFSGAPIAPYQGGLNQPTDSNLSQSRVSRPGRTSVGGAKAAKVGYPMTGGPHGMGVSGGHGPKPGNSGYTKKTYQGGRTKGKDMGPKPMKDRFRGGAVPKSK